MSSFAIAVVTVLTFVSGELEIQSVEDAFESMEECNTAAQQVLPLFRNSPEINDVAILCVPVPIPETS